MNAHVSLKNFNRNRLSRFWDISYLSSTVDFCVLFITYESAFGGGGNGNQIRFVWVLRGYRNLRKIFKDGFERNLCCFFSSQSGCSQILSHPFFFFFLFLIMWKIADMPAYQIWSKPLKMDLREICGFFFFLKAVALKFRVIHYCFFNHAENSRHASTSNSIEIGSRVYTW